MSFWKKPRIGDTYLWTEHSRMKMRHYRLTESRVKRIIRHPARIEEGVLEHAIAAMQPAEGKNYSEIWTMFVLKKTENRNQKPQIRVITAWRYPGKSPARDPVPTTILKEVRGILFT